MFKKYILPIAFLFLISQSNSFGQGVSTQYSVSELSTTAKDTSAPSDDKKDKKKEEDKPFEEIIKDYKVIKGLFTIYQKEDEGKIYLEIKPDQFNKVYLCSVTREAADGTYFDSESMMQNFPFTFKRVGKKVMFVYKNIAFRAEDNSPISRAIQRGVSDSILGSVKIESLAHPERGSFLVDPSGFFIQDIGMVGFVLSQGNKEIKYDFDKDNSYFGKIQSFPENTEIETILNFKSGNPKPAPTIPDPRSFQHTYHYSLSALPDTGYKPRIADDRVGHFLTIYQDYSSVQRDTPYNRYITRWQLEKENPSAAVSTPKKPIVFWLENTVPLEYRDAVREGILLWNSAFEKIGFKDAIVVKQQPDNADWDAADTRYNTIRWMVQPGSGYAVGPSRANPYTGQIYDADIRFSADLVRSVFLNAEDFAKPLASGDKIMRSLRLFNNYPDNYCDYPSGATLDAGFGYNLLDIRSELGDGKFDTQKYIHDYIVHLVAHEVGHTLGLRHNFKGTSVYTAEDNQSGKLTNSVMDYVPSFIAIKGQKQGPYMQTTLGPYDYWAIEYAYKPIDSKTPEGEKSELDKIASKAADPLLQYGTDEDTFDDGRNIDPSSNRFDLSNEPISFYKNRVALVKELWSNLEKKYEVKGNRYQKMRVVFERGLAQYNGSVTNLTKYIGGIYYHRDHVGDPNGRIPFEPVPASKQREALDFINQNIFGAQAFQFSPELLNKLAPERFYDFTDSLWEMKRLDYPIHDKVLGIQKEVLYRLYDPILLSRVSDSELHTYPKEKPLTLSELFLSMRNAIWTELYKGENVNSFRRSLQRAQLDILTGFVVNPTKEIPEDARTLARADLTALNSLILQAQTSNTINAETRAHLDETKSRIDASLKAGIERKLTIGK